MNIQKELFSLQDLKYRDFHSKLMPDIAKEFVIGVRVPDLRKLAKDFSKTGESRDFIKNLPHKYYEENNVHAFVLEQIKDFNEALCETKSFLPYIDNWATCDMFLPKVFAKNKDKLIIEIKEWIKSDKPFTVRYAIVLLMKLYLNDDFKEEYMEMVSSAKSEHYYVKMAIAWYFATALAKQYDLAIRYITDKKLEKWTHNKAIQKAIESRVIPEDIKEYLKGEKL